MIIPFLKFLIVYFDLNVMKKIFVIKVCKNNIKNIIFYIEFCFKSLFMEFKKKNKRFTRFLYIELLASIYHVNFLLNPLLQI